ncbi:TSUP family transporter [Pseudomonas sp. NPDC007930]|uniref:sulfite exporter TauE/SafE family protein n=1 Tax=Pseudomonas sp. NPDC007930 TaxID=3364417 RepID=UPI0036E7AF51
MNELLALGLPSYLVILLVLLCAYIIFGVAGFGSALIAGPFLAWYIPVAKIVPLLALIDLCAAIINVSRDGRSANWPELKRLVPLMMLGSLVGATLLLNIHPEALMLALGLFVVAYALYALLGRRPQRTFSPRHAIPFGSVGGVCSALFGSGGFIYAIYLSGRLPDKNAMRTTQVTLIGLSTLTRVVLFALAGVYLDTSVLWLAVCLAPGMIMGVVIGRRLTLKMSREQFLKVINVVVLAAGVMLVVRYFVG